MAVFQHAAMAVVGVFAEAEIGDHHHLGRRPPGVTHHAGDQPIRPPCIAAGRVLVVRYAEQHHRFHSIGGEEFYLALQLAFGDAMHARHAGDWLAVVDAFFHEDRLDQILGCQHGLAHKGAQGRRPPQATKAGDRETAGGHVGYPAAATAGLLRT